MPWSTMTTTASMWPAMQRHAFKPGITGLAQVEGWRGETAELESMARRIDADLRYQRNWSLS